MKVLVIDTETTGLLEDPDATVIEIGLAVFDAAEAKIVEARSVPVDPGLDDVGPVEVHGLTLPIVRQGISADAARAMLDTIIDDVDALVAHNANFDRLMLERMGWSCHAPWVCTRDDFPWPGITRPGKQVEIALHYGVGVVEAHRALPDVLTLCRIFERLKVRGHDVRALFGQAIEAASEPKVTVQAMVSYDDRQQAKAARFRWNGDAKRWERTVRKSLALNNQWPFQVRRVSS